MPCLCVTREGLGHCGPLERQHGRVPFREGLNSSGEQAGSQTERLADVQCVTRLPDRRKLAAEGIIRGVMACRVTNVTIVKAAESNSATHP
jgi:hypothetical protein